MINDTQKRLVAIRNEIKAQKVARELVYSQLLMPANTPEARFTDTVPVGSTAQNGIVARCVVTFTRTDGIQGTPFVNFPFDVTLSPTTVQHAATQGVTITGDDVGYADEQCFVGYVAGASTNSVDFYVDFTETLLTNFDPNYPGVTFTIDVQAISTVPGQISVERVL